METYLKIILDLENQLSGIKMYQKMLLKKWGWQLPVLQVGLKAAVFVCRQKMA